MDPWNYDAYGFTRFNNQQNPFNPQPQPNSQTPPNSQWAPYMTMLGATQSPGGGIHGFNANVNESVPETQPPPQAEGPSTGRKKSRAHKKKEPGQPRAPKNTIPWTGDEYEALARAWLAVSEDPQCANYIKYNEFWTRVTRIFFDLGGNRERQRDSISSKWGDVNYKCNLYQSIYSRIKSSWGSGANDENIINATNSEYQQRAGAFLYTKAWTRLKDHPKWIFVNSAPASSGSGRPSKRSKTNTDDSRDPETPVSDARNIDLNDETEPDHDDVFEIPRPAGRRRKSKGKAAAGTSGGDEEKAVSTQFEEMNIRLDRLHNLGRERLEVIKDRQLDKDIEILSAELPPDDPTLLDMKERRRRNIMARWGY